MLLTLVAFLVVLAVLIVSHELGHFAVAKATGVKVEEFGVGFPPRLASVTRGETRYSLNLIPLGGFTKMAGEEDPSLPRSLASKGAGTRLLVLGAGPLMNALLPLLLFSVAFMVPFTTVSGRVIVQQVAAGSPAEAAGIQVGDEIVGVNGQPVHNNNELARYIELDLGQETSLIVKRAGEVLDLSVVPRWKAPQGQGPTGIVTSTVDAVVGTTRYPLWKAVPAGVEQSVQTFLLFKNGIISLVIGAVPFEVAGPVGIAELTGQVAREGINPLLEFAAFLSINLAIINILPLPALDGGRIFFVVLEWLRRGKRVSPRTEGLVHAIGFAVLMAAVIAVTYQDIVRIASGGSLVP